MVPYLRKIHPIAYAVAVSKVGIFYESEFDCIENYVQISFSKNTGNRVIKFPDWHLLNLLLSFNPVPVPGTLMIYY